MRIKKNTGKAILKDCCPERVSAAAAEKLVDVIETYAYDIAKTANNTRLLVGRHTILEEDIDYAVKQYKQNQNKSY